MVKLNDRIIQKMIHHHLWEIEDVLKKRVKHMNKDIKSGDPLAFERDYFQDGIPLNMSMTAPPEISHEKGTIELHIDGRFYDTHRGYELVPANTKAAVARVQDPDHWD